MDQVNRKGDQLKEFNHLGLVFRMTAHNKDRPQSPSVTFEANN